MNGHSDPQFITRVFVRPRSKIDGIWVSHTDRGGVAEFIAWSSGHFILRYESYCDMIPFSRPVDCRFLCVDTVLEQGRSAGIALHQSRFFCNYEIKRFCSCCDERRNGRSGGNLPEPIDIFFCEPADYQVRTLRYSPTCLSKSWMYFGDDMSLGVAFLKRRIYDFFCSFGCRARLDPNEFIIVEELFAPIYEGKRFIAKSAWNNPRRRSTRDWVGTGPQSHCLFEIHQFSLRSLQRNQGLHVLANSARLWRGLDIEGVGRLLTVIEEEVTFESENGLVEDVLIAFFGECIEHAEPLKLMLNCSEPFISAPALSAQPLSPPIGSKLLLSFVRTIERLHTLGLIHRDLNHHTVLVSLVSDEPITIVRHCLMMMSNPQTHGGNEIGVNGCVGLIGFNPPECLDSGQKLLQHNHLKNRPNNAQNDLIHQSTKLFENKFKSNFFNNDQAHSTSASYSSLNNLLPLPTKSNTSLHITSVTENGPTHASDIHLNVNISKHKDNTEILNKGDTQKVVTQNIVSSKERQQCSCPSACSSSSLSDVCSSSSSSFLSSEDDEEIKDKNHVRRHFDSKGATGNKNFITQSLEEFMISWRISPIVTALLPIHVNDLRRNNPTTSDIREMKLKNEKASAYHRKHGHILPKKSEKINKCVTEQITHPSRIPASNPHFSHANDKHFNNYSILSDKSDSKSLSFKGQDTAGKIHIFSTEDRSSEDQPNHLSSPSSFSSPSSPMRQQCELPPWLSPPQQSHVKNYSQKSSPYSNNNTSLVSCLKSCQISSLTSKPAYCCSPKVEIGPNNCEQKKSTSLYNLNPVTSSSIITSPNRENNVKKLFLFNPQIENASNNIKGLNVIVSSSSSKLQSVIDKQLTSAGTTCQSYLDQAVKCLPSTPKDSNYSLNRPLALNSANIFPRNHVDRHESPHSSFHFPQSHHQLKVTNVSHNPSQASSSYLSQSMTPHPPMSPFPKKSNQQLSRSNSRLSVSSINHPSTANQFQKPSDEMSNKSPDIYARQDSRNSKKSYAFSTELITEDENILELLNEVFHIDMFNKQKYNKEGQKLLYELHCMANNAFQKFHTKIDNCKSPIPNSRSENNFERRKNKDEYGRLNSSIFVLKNKNKNENVSTNDHKVSNKLSKKKEDSFKSAIHSFMFMKSSPSITSTSNTANVSLSSKTLQNIIYSRFNLHPFHSALSSVRSLTSTSFNWSNQSDMFLVGLVAHLMFFGVHPFGAQPLPVERLKGTGLQRRDSKSYVSRKGLSEVDNSHQSECNFNKIGTSPSIQSRSVSKIAPQFKHLDNYSLFNSSDFQTLRTFHVPGSLSFPSLVTLVNRNKLSDWAIEKVRLGIKAITPLDKLIAPLLAKRPSDRPTAFQVASNFWLRSRAGENPLNEFILWPEDRGYGLFGDGRLPIIANLGSNRWLSLHNQLITDPGLSRRDPLYVYANQKSSPEYPGCFGSFSSSILFDSDPMIMKCSPIPSDLLRISLEIYCRCLNCRSYRINPDKKLIWSLPETNKRVKNIANCTCTAQACGSSVECWKQILIRDKGSRMVTHGDGMFWLCVFLFYYNPICMNDGDIKCSFEDASDPTSKTSSNSVHSPQCSSWNYSVFKNPTLRHHFNVLAHERYMYMVAHHRYKADHAIRRTRIEETRKQKEHKNNLTSKASKFDEPKKVQYDQYAPKLSDLAPGSIHAALSWISPVSTSIPSTIPATPDEKTSNRELENKQFPCDQDQIHRDSSEFRKEKPPIYSNQPPNGFNIKKTDSKSILHPTSIDNLNPNLDHKKIDIMLNIYDDIHTLSREDHPIKRFQPRKRLSPHKHIHSFDSATKRSSKLTDPHSSFSRLGFFVKSAPCDYKECQSSISPSPCRFRDRKTKRPHLQLNTKNIILKAKAKADTILSPSGPISPPPPCTPVLPFNDSLPLVAVSSARPPAPDDFIYSIDEPLCLSYPFLATKPLSPNSTQTPFFEGNTSELARARRRVISNHTMKAVTAATALNINQIYKYVGAHPSVTSSTFKPVQSLDLSPLSFSIMSKPFINPNPIPIYNKSMHNANIGCKLSSPSCIVGNRKKNKNKIRQKIRKLRKNDLLNTVKITTASNLFQNSNNRSIDDPIQELETFPMNHVENPLLGGESRFTNISSRNENLKPLYDKSNLDNSNQMFSSTFIQNYPSDLKTFRKENFVTYPILKYLPTSSYSLQRTGRRRTTAPSNTFTVRHLESALISSPYFIEAAQNIHPINQACGSLFSLTNPNLLFSSFLKKESGNDFLEEQKIAKPELDSDHESQNNTISPLSLTESSQMSDANVKSDFSVKRFIRRTLSDSFKSPDVALSKFKGNKEISPISSPPLLCNLKIHKLRSEEPYMLKPRKSIVPSCVNQFVRQRNRLGSLELKSQTIVERGGGSPATDPEVLLAACTAQISLNAVDSILNAGSGIIHSSAISKAALLNRLNTSTSPTNEEGGGCDEDEGNFHFPSDSIKNFFSSYINGEDASIICQESVSIGSNVSPKSNLTDSLHPKSFNYAPINAISFHKRPLDESDSIMMKAALSLVTYGEMPSILAKTYSNMKLPVLKTDEPSSEDKIVHVSSSSCGENLILSDNIVNHYKDDYGQLKLNNALEEELNEDIDKELNLDEQIKVDSTKESSKTNISLSTIQISSSPSKSSIQKDYQLNRDTKSDVFNKNLLDIQQHKLNSIDNSEQSFFISNSSSSNNNSTRLKVHAHVHQEFHENSKMSFIPQRLVENTSSSGVVHAVNSKNKNTFPCIFVTTTHSDYNDEIFHHCGMDGDNDSRQSNNQVLTPNFAQFPISTPIFQLGSPHQIRCDLLSRNVSSGKNNSNTDRSVELHPNRDDWNNIFPINIDSLPTFIFDDQLRSLTSGEDENHSTLPSPLKKQLFDDKPLLFNQTNQKEEVNPTLSNAPLINSTTLVEICSNDQQNINDKNVNIVIDHQQNQYHVSPTIQTKKSQSVRRSRLFLLKSSSAKTHEISPMLLSPSSSSSIQIIESSPLVENVLKELHQLTAPLQTDNNNSCVSNIKKDDDDAFSAGFQPNLSSTSSSEFLPQVGGTTQPYMPREKKLNNRLNSTIVPGPKRFLPWMTCSPNPLKGRQNRLSRLRKSQKKEFNLTEGNDLCDLHKKKKQELIELNKKFPMTSIGLNLSLRSPSPCSSCERKKTVAQNASKNSLSSHSTSKVKPGVVLEADIEDDDDTENKTESDIFDEPATQGDSFSYKSQDPSGSLSYNLNKNSSSAVKTIDQTIESYSTVNLVSKKSSTSPCTPVAAQVKATSINRDADIEAIWKEPQKNHKGNQISPLNISIKQKNIQSLSNIDSSTHLLPDQEDRLHVKPHLMTQSTLDMWNQMNKPKNLMAQAASHRLANLNFEITPVYTRKAHTEVIQHQKILKSTIGHPMHLPPLDPIGSKSPTIPILRSDQANNCSSNCVSNFKFAASGDKCAMVLKDNGNFESPDRLVQDTSHSNLQIENNRTTCVQNEFNNNPMSSSVTAAGIFGDSDNECKRILEQPNQQCTPYRTSKAHRDNQFPSSANTSTSHQNSDSLISSTLVESISHLQPRALSPPCLLSSSDVTAKGVIESMRDKEKQLDELLSPCPVGGAKNIAFSQKYEMAKSAEQGSALLNNEGAFDSPKKIENSTFHLTKDSNNSFFLSSESSFQSGTYNDQFRGLISLIHESHSKAYNVHDLQHSRHQSEDSIFKSYHAIINNDVASDSLIRDSLFNYCDPPRSLENKNELNLSMYSLPPTYKLSENPSNHTSPRSQSQLETESAVNNPIFDSRTIKVEEMDEKDIHNSILRHQNPINSHSGKKNNNNTFKMIPDSNITSEKEASTDDQQEENNLFTEWIKSGHKKYDTSLSNLKVQKNKISSPPSDCFVSNPKVQFSNFSIFHPPHAYERQEISVIIPPTSKTKRVLSSDPCLKSFDSTSTSMKSVTSSTRRIAAKSNLREKWCFEPEQSSLKPLMLVINESKQRISNLLEKEKVSYGLSVISPSCSLPLSSFSNGSKDCKLKESKCAFSGCLSAEKRYQKNLQRCDTVLFDAWSSLKSPLLSHILCGNYVPSQSVLHYMPFRSMISDLFGDYRVSNDRTLSDLHTQKRKKKPFFGFIFILRLKVFYSTLSPHFLRFMVKLNRVWFNHKEDILALGMCLTAALYLLYLLLKNPTDFEKSWE